MRHYLQTSGVNVLKDGLADTVTWMVGTIAI